MADGKSGHLMGGKYTASHTSVIDAAVPLLRAAAKLDCVSKIALGVIRRVPAADPQLKFLDDGPGSLLAKIRGRTSIQEVRIYTSDKEATISLISGLFGPRD